MNRFQLMLAVGMLVTGSLNTIFNKLSDWESSEGEHKHCIGKDIWPSESGVGSGEASGEDLPGPCKFVHPFFQALMMFIGESTCLGAFYFGRTTGKLAPPKKFNYFIFLLPACCDMTATSLMYIGLLLTYASSFQMLRASVIIFTALISRVIMKRRMRNRHYGGISLVTIGTVVVAIDSIINPDASAAAPPNPVLGNIIIILAQIVVAIQMCIEEVFVGGADVHPLQAVGLEGLFGSTVIFFLLIAMYFLPGLENLSETKDHFEDSIDALRQVGNNGVLAFWVIGGIFSIAFFNFFGISVTKSMSAAHRMVLDSVRTLVVWGFSLCVRAASPDSGHGQSFSALQLVGFIVLVCGTLLYNGIVPQSWLRTIDGADFNEPLLEAKVQQEPEPEQGQPVITPIVASNDVLPRAAGDLQADREQQRNYN